MTSWWRIWWVSLAAKFALAIWLPLAPDEAYYWVWAQAPQLSYYDHPPMVAWLLWLGSLLPTWGVRLPAVLLAHLGLYFWSRALFAEQSAEQQRAWLILVLFMPLVGPGSLIVTPDLALVFTWGFALWAMRRLLRENNWSNQLWLGLAIGLGLLAKYHIVLLAPVLIAWWWSERRVFPPLRGLVTVILSALIISWPLWLWNWQNDFVSFRFQLAHGLGRPHWKPSWTYEYILGQVGLIFPTLLVCAIRSRGPLALQLLAWFPLTFFLFTTARGYVEANWPLVAHPAVAALAVWQWPRVRSWILVTVGLWASLLAALLVVVALPDWPQWLKRTKLADVRRFDDIVGASADYQPLYARSYQMASILSFKQQRIIPKLKGINRRDFFDSLAISLPATSRFYVIVEHEDVLPEPWRNWHITVIKELDAIHRLIEVEQP